MRNWIDDNQFAIAPSAVSTPYRLKDLGVGPPNIAPIGYANYVVRSDATRVPTGYLRCQWVWDRISRASVNSILVNTLNVTDSVYSVAVVMTTDARDGKQAKPEWKTYTATLLVPDLSGDDGTSVPNSPYAFQSFRLQFINLQEVV